MLSKGRNSFRIRPFGTARTIGSFDEAVTRHAGIFAVEKEVEGFYFGSRYGVDLVRPRIDRILIPCRKLIEAGWTQGPIGVEGKRSGEHIGPAISQAADYTRAAFALPSRMANCRIVLEWCFIWPVAKVYGDLASIMDQNRIGAVWLYPSGHLRFTTAGPNAITVDAAGNVMARTLAMGRKRGSR